MSDLAFHMVDGKLAVTVDGVLVTPDYLSNIALNLNNNDEIQKILSEVMTGPTEPKAE